MPSNQATRNLLEAISSNEDPVASIGIENEFLLVAKSYYNEHQKLQ